MQENIKVKRTIKPLLYQLTDMLPLLLLPLPPPLPAIATPPATAKRAITSHFQPL
jgi:hypothetical protein